MTGTPKAGFVEVGPVRTHVRSLLDAEVTLAAVCRAVGANRSTVEHLLREDACWVREETATALRALNVEACTAHESTTAAAPVRDHLRMLLDVDDLTGYQLRKHIGLETRTFDRLLDESVATVKQDVAAKVLAVAVGDIKTTRLYRVDATPAREHIAALVKLNVTFEQIAERSGVHAHTISRIHHGRSPMVDADTVDWITGVPLSLADEVAVPAAPVRAHIQSLIEREIPRRQIAILAGVGITTVKHIELGFTSTTSREIAEQIMAVTPEHQQLVNPWVDPQKVREHIAALARSNVPFRHVAAAAQTTPSTVWRIHSGNPTKVTLDLANRIFAVTPATVVLPASTKVPAIGSLRRIQALNCAAWPTKTIAKRLGLTGLNLSTKKQVTKGTADRIDEVYREWKDVTGPSARTATWAANQGFVPSRYWDAETIDDPSATPAMGRPARARRR